MEEVKALIISGPIYNKEALTFKIDERITPFFQQCKTSTKPDLIILQYHVQQCCYRTLYDDLLLKFSTCHQA